MKILMPTVFVCLCALIVACAGEKQDIAEKDAKVRETVEQKKETRAPAKKVVQPAKAETDIPKEQIKETDDVQPDGKEESENPSEEGDDRDTAQTQAGDPELTEKEGISLRSIVLANGIEKIDGKKKPMNPGKVFSLSDTERVIAFMSVSNPESVETELQVSFLPPESEKERGKVSVSIPAHTKWSTRAFHRLKGPKGVWSVIVRHDGEVIAKAPFELVE